MATILTLNNCHRAASVRKIGEDKEFLFGYRKANNANARFRLYVHKLTAEDGEIREVADRDMNQYEVLSWKYVYNFEDLYNDGVRAFSATSYEPECRSLQYIKEYEDMLNSDLSKLPKSEYEQYYSKFRSWVVELFGKHSRIMSAMITGPANFPTRRNQSANNAYDKAYNDFQEWRINTRKRLLRKMEASKTPDERLEDEWKPLKKEIIQSGATMLAIDIDNYPYSRSAFVNSLYGKLERIAMNGKKELVAKSLELIEQLSDGMIAKGGKPMFTKRHKVWKLPEVCATAIHKTEARSETEDAEYPFEGGMVIKNYSKNRLQIVHDEKPSREVIDKLKLNGFRWAPSQQAWQRQLTDNALYAAARVVPLTVEELRQAPPSNEA